MGNDLINFNLKYATKFVKRPDLTNENKFMGQKRIIHIGLSLKFHIMMTTPRNAPQNGRNSVRMKCLYKISIVEDEEGSVKKEEEGRRNSAKV